MARWIEDWFGSTYYSMLYKHRNNNEASLFLNNLISFLKIPGGSSFLDCGCGKGRHSLYLAEKGYEVTGMDISEQNIQEAKRFEKANLSFYVHDMRNLPFYQFWIF
jgi:2-polyprenyl-3-methyl-5-hydroxy-6-metoxy-1,4-benzoquinol methylase